MYECVWIDVLYGRWRRHGSDCFFFFQAEDGIRDLVRSRGLGDVYKRQQLEQCDFVPPAAVAEVIAVIAVPQDHGVVPLAGLCLLYTSDAADERSSVDLGGRRIIKKKRTI